MQLHVQYSMGHLVSCHRGSSLLTMQPYFVYQGSIALPVQVSGIVTFTYVIKK
jgi:hypothetical protein